MGTRAEGILTKVDTFFSNFCVILFKVDESLKNNRKGKAKAVVSRDVSVKGCGMRNTKESTLTGREEAASGHFDASEMDWEEGIVSTSDCREGFSHDLGKDVIVEFTGLPSPAERKINRRVSSEEKVSY